MKKKFNKDADKDCLLVLDQFLTPIKDYLSRDIITMYEEKYFRQENFEKFAITD